VKFGRPEVGEIARAYLTKNRVASARIAPKICQGQRQTMYSECPKLHPNPFTSGGVIAERVNTVQPRHKVFPILGEAISSSQSNSSKYRQARTYTWKVRYIQTCGKR